MVYGYNNSDPERGMLKVLKIFELGIIIVLVVLMAIVVVMSIIGLGRMIVTDILTVQGLIFSISTLMDIFGFFLLILIGIELLETIKAYITDNEIRVEIVLLVGIMAIARKVIILDLTKTPSLSLIGVGVIIISLAGGYYLIRRAKRENTKNNQPPSN